MEKDISQTYYVTYGVSTHYPRGQGGKRPLTYVLICLLGVLLGVFLIFAGTLTAKWVIIIVAVGCFPILAVAMRSLKAPLQVVLILSLSMSMDIVLYYSEKYVKIHPGIQITLPGLILVSLYFLWLFDICFTRKTIRLFPSITIPFGILTSWAGLSFFVSSRPLYVLLGFPVFVNAFLLYFYSANWVRTREDIKFVIRTMAITVLFSAMLGICQYAAGSDFGLTFLGGADSQVMQDYQTESLSRVSGLLRHPNSFALFLNGMLPILLVYSIAERGFLSYLCRLSFLLGFITLVLTYSRGGWVAFALSLFIMIIYTHKMAWRSKLRELRKWIILLPLGISVIVIPFSSQIFTRITKDDYGAAHSRIPLAKMSLSIIRENPIAGVGLNNYRFASSGIDDTGTLYFDPTDEWPMRVHNIFLHTAAELGLPAVALLIWILVFFFARGTYAIKKYKGPTGTFALGLVGGIVGITAHGMIEPGTFADPQYLSMLLIGGYLVGLKEMKESY